MYQAERTSFRQDLIVTQSSNKKNQAKVYLIKDPKNGQTFEFGEEEYFLCQSLDGNTPPQQVLVNFRKRFGFSLSREDFNGFCDQLVGSGLLETVMVNKSIAAPAPVSTAPEEINPLELTAPPLVTPTAEPKSSTTEALHALGRESLDIPSPKIQVSEIEPPQRNNWLPQLGLILFLIGLMIVALLPYPYRPGGQVTLLPPTQQAIQAPVSGKVVLVKFKGGDSRMLKKGTPIATMEAVDLENNAKTTAQQVYAQQAVLDKLLNTPRPEDVAVAQSAVNTATENIEVAKKALESAVSQAKFSAIQAERYKTLFQQGAYAASLYDQAKTQADVDVIAVEGQKRNLEAVQLALKQQKANFNLVKAGPHPEDIKSARAELARLKQELRFSREQIKRTQLYMPIYGHLVTAYLDQKINSYLNQGSTYAVAEDDRNIFGEVQVPEYDAGLIRMGARVELKLLAYSNEPIIGKVKSVEPVAVLAAYGRVVKVVVEIPNSKRILRQGMSGYAKIDGGKKPVILAFTQPIIRFVLVEIWSWLP